MKQFRVIAFNGRQTLKGIWYNCDDWTIKEILDFIVPAYKHYDNWQLEYRG